MCEATLNVEGAKTNTLPKTNTCRHLPIVNTLLPWTITTLYRSAWDHKVTVLGAIRDAIS